MIDSPGEPPNARPSPEDTSTTCTANPLEIAEELRASVRDMRLLQIQHGPGCNGHPVSMGHMMALHIANLLERGL